MDFISYLKARLSKLIKVSNSRFYQSSIWKQEESKLVKYRMRDSLILGNHTRRNFVLPTYFIRSIKPNNNLNSSSGKNINKIFIIHKTIDLWSFHPSIQLSNYAYKAWN